MDRPVPTPRAVWLVALGLAPALAAVVSPGALALAAALDGLVITLVALDYVLAPPPRALRVRRDLESVLSSGVANRVRLHLEAPTGDRRTFRGELRDAVEAGPLVEGLSRRFELRDHLELDGTITPMRRGDLQLLGLWLRLVGPMGLCARQARVDPGGAVRVFPDLSALHARDALALARAGDAESRRHLPRRAEGREFDSLREHRLGDDRRSIDWKATARRGRTMVRVHRPERNQRVLILLDCGRHMAGEIGGRRKLDHAVDAALRLGRVALDLGDEVGVVAFGAKVKASLPARKGPEQLRAITQSLYRLDATLEESDYGTAFDAAFARDQRRSLVVIMTDLLDADSSRALLQRTRRLVPRHLPLVVSLFDDDVHRTALALPATTGDAYRRLVASGLEREAAATVAYLRRAGAHVLRASFADFGGASVGAYLAIKERGAL